MVMTTRSGKPLSLLNTAMATEANKIPADREQQSGLEDGRDTYFGRGRSICTGTIRPSSRLSHLCSESAARPRPRPWRNCGQPRGQRRGVHMHKTDGRRPREEEEERRVRRQYRC